MLDNEQKELLVSVFKYGSYITVFSATLLWGITGFDLSKLGYWSRGLIAYLAVSLIVGVALWI